MNRIQEIQARLQEIREMTEDAEKRGDAKFTDLEQEARELREELEELEARQRMKEEAERMNQGQGEYRTVETFNDNQSTGNEVNVRNMKWDEAIGTEEYRTAWAKDMMGQKLSEEERGVLEQVNTEYRDFTHDTENSQILIPQTVASGIWRRAEEEYPLWADVRKFRVRGNLSMLKGSGSKDARWYDEDKEVETDELEFGQLNLTGHELAKAIQVTWKLKKMSIQEFEAYIIREIGDRMGISLSKAVYEGKGQPGDNENFKPEPYGIKTRLESEDDTPQIQEYSDDLEYKGLTEMMGGLFSSYVNGATIYASNATIWSVLANVVDGQGRPMFVADVMSGGVGRIFGRTIKADATIPDGEIMLGNLSQGYVANINEDITMYREDHVRKRVTDYMGYAIVDGDVLDNKAFVILKEEDAPEE